MGLVAKSGKGEDASKVRGRYKQEIADSTCFCEHSLGVCLSAWGYEDSSCAVHLIQAVHSLVDSEPPERCFFSLLTKKKKKNWPMRLTGCVQPYIAPSPKMLKLN